jgi:hypothetical protein
VLSFSPTLQYMYQLEKRKNDGEEPRSLMDGPDQTEDEEKCAAVLAQIAEEHAWRASLPSLLLVRYCSFSHSFLPS